MAKTIYRVYGMDTYDHETFTVADFGTREEAEAKLKECRDSVMDQCEELRDFFWIAEMTHKEFVERQKQEAELRAVRYAARAFDMTQLEENCKSVLESIKTQIAGKTFSYNWDGSNECNEAEAEVIPEKKVCYNYLVMYLYSTKGGRLGIQLKPYLYETCVEKFIALFDSEDELHSWLDSPESVQDTIRTMVELIDRYA